MASSQQITPRIIRDMEQNLFRIVYAMGQEGEFISDSYFKKLANEIYIYLRQTKTYNPNGDRRTSGFNKGTFYEHVARTDGGLDLHLDITFGHMSQRQWCNLFKCNLCEVRYFKRAQNLVRHLFWHAMPVVSRDTTDADLKFEASNEWLLQFKKDFMWPKIMYK